MNNEDIWRFYPSEAIPSSCLVWLVLILISCFAVAISPWIGIVVGLFSTFLLIVFHLFLINKFVYPEYEAMKDRERNKETEKLLTLTRELA